MNWIPKSTADNLPDEVLATILKLLADLPLPLLDRTPPAPVAASRVNRRWRTVALGSPELWTNIRISHRSRSFPWAAVFMRRSGSYPLDISINLESYRARDKIAYDAPLPLSKALTIVGSHIGRWRTLALRGWRPQVEEFNKFVAQAPVAPSRLESAHLSVMESYDEHSSPVRLFQGGALRSLRLNMELDTDGFAAFRGIRSLDINCRVNYFTIQSPEFRKLVEVASQLTTLVFRNFNPYPRQGTDPDPDPIDCPTIQSFAISFDRPFYYHYSSEHPNVIGGFDTFTSAFTLPNIEHLEIVGGFSGDYIEDRLMQVPEDWEAPLFPRLRTLRLEDMSFGRTGLAMIQSFSKNITTLQLIYTRQNPHLLAHPRGWPSLRALTVEKHREVVAPGWLGPFVAMRAAMGACISDLTLPKWDGVIIALVEDERAPTIHWQGTGPSHALMDGVQGPGFYLDEFDMRPADFAYVKFPGVRLSCLCCGFDWDQWILERDLELLEEDIARDFKMEGDLLRSRGRQRASGKRGPKHRDSKGRGLRGHRRRGDIREDFFVV